MRNLKKLKDKTLKEFEKKIEGNLEKIYKNQNGEISDFSVLEKKKTNWIKRVLFIQFTAILSLFLFLAAVLFINNSKNENESSVRVEFFIPKDISSGDEISLTVKYKNIENFTLNDSELVMHYPEGFEFYAADPMPTNQYHDIWKLGNLVRGAEGVITIKGKIIGDVGSLVTFKASFSYTPENFSSPFKKVFTSPTFLIASSILTLEILGKEKIVSEEATSYRLKYANASDATLSNVRIVAHYPSGFSLRSTVPKPSEQNPGESEKVENKEAKSNNVWDIKELKAGENGEIAIEGDFRNIEGSILEFSAEIGMVNEDNFFAYQRANKKIEVINSGLKIDVSVNNSKEDLSVNFSDTLNYSIILKNLGERTLYNLRLAAFIDSGVLDWDTLIDKSAGVRENNKIFWGSINVPQLSMLLPLDEAQIDFSIKIKGLKLVDIEADNLKTSLRVEAAIEKIDDISANVQVLSKTITAQINTDLELTSQGRYFDDDNIAVGQGPLPPEVGKKTVLRIYWKLSNNLHEVTDVSIKTKIADGVLWEDKFSATLGELVYSSKDSTVVWKIPKIPPQKSFEDLQAWFDVSATPSEDMVGKLILITSETSLKAVDSVTRSGISHVNLGITSNLEDDPFGGGRGLVVSGEE